MGYSVDADHASNNKEPDVKPDVIWGHNALREPLREKQRGSDLIQSLIDEMIQSTRRSELLESQIVVAKGPVRDIISEQEPTMHRYSSDSFNCRKFQRDLLDVCNPSHSACQRSRCLERIPYNNSLTLNSIVLRKFQGTYLSPGLP